VVVVVVVNAVVSITEVLGGRVGARVAFVVTSCVVVVFVVVAARKRDDVVVVACVAEGSIDSTHLLSTHHVEP